MNWRRLWVLAGWAMIVFQLVLTTGFAVHRLAEVTQNGILQPFEDPDPFDRRYNQHPAASYLHILPGMLFMWLGPWQFIPRIRSRHLRLHRWLGRIYLVVGALAGSTAILLAFLLPAYGGSRTASAATVFGVGMLYSLFRAYRHVRKGEIDQHREWMIRGFAIGMGVAMIRVWLLTWGLLTTGPVFQHFGTAFWLGLATNAAAAEIWIRYTRRRPAAVTL